MRRRALLAALCGAGGTATVGCLDREPPAGSEPSDDTQTGSVTDTTQPTDTATEAGSTTATDGAPTAVDPAVGVPPGETDCPVPEPESTVRVVCTPVGGTPPDGTGLTASAEAVGPAEDTIEFTLRNGTDTRLDVNFYGWSLWERRPDDWRRVAPDAWPEPLMSLGPGESHTWTLRVGERGAGEGPSEKSDIAVGELEGGEYAFAVDGWFASTDHEHKTAFAVRFRVES
jgi:hypothetical protein